MPRGTLERTQSADADDEAPLSRAGECILHTGRDRPIRISAGHHLPHHDSKCSRPHGHNYEISVCVVDDLTDEGWVVDRGIVTDVIDKWDHRFLVESGDPLVEAFEYSGDADGTVVPDVPPMAEVTAVVLEEKLLAALSGIVSEASVSVSETSELCAGF